MHIKMLYPSEINKFSSVETKQGINSTGSLKKLETPLSLILFLPPYYLFLILDLQGPFLLLFRSFFYQL